MTNRAAIGAIVLSGSAETAAAMLKDDLPHLCQTTAIPVFIGGRVVERYPDTIAAAGAIALGEDLGLALRRIGAVLARR